MKYLPICACLLLLLAACGTVTVNPDDSTPPQLTVSLVNGRALDAHYDGSSDVVDGAVDTSRSFAVRPRNDRHKVQLMFSAKDAQSGISQLRASMDVSFTCGASVPGNPPNVSKEAHASFNDSYFGRTDGGMTASVQRIVLVEFSLEDLWRKSDCSTWGQYVDVNNGRISNIHVSYSGKAWNNSQPASPATGVSGEFSSSGGRVDLTR